MYHHQTQSLIGSSITKWRIGSGYGTSEEETLWSTVWFCSDGWEIWIENEEPVSPAQKD